MFRSKPYLQPLPAQLKKPIHSFSFPRTILPPPYSGLTYTYHLFFSDIIMYNHRIPELYGYVTYLATI